ncbi:MAG: lytic transglycosylase domain-containing protein [Lachnospiraceae bacterium]|nr:lytic transglycosylase domain-containing protein [Lachnospiraceae bacterium]MBQ9935074.1 lytic transglycosylase domain-containing protein [Lachnospiraceae bacterium]
MYIDGLGYVDENVYNAYAVANATKASNNATTKNIGQSVFDQLLEQEKANKAPAEKTMDLDSIFAEASKKYGVSVDLLKAVAKAESNFNPEATSHCGAMGIMQLMPATAESLGVTDAYDPYQNIMGGAKLLSQLDKLYDGNVKLMLAGYNAGPGNVEKYGGVPPFEETQNYVVTVMRYLEQGVDTNGKTVTVNGDTTQIGYDQTVTDQQLADLQDKLDEYFSYSEYQMLMTYFNTMLDIIASIGDTDDSSSGSDENDSLADLFRLGSIQYNKRNIDLI